MARIIGIDYGKKRVGIAVTDPDQMIASPLTTLGPQEVFLYLKEYLNNHEVEGFAVGDPKKMNATPSESSEMVHSFINGLKNKFPELPVYLIDERFTSKMAFQTLIDGGLKKKARQNKALVDAVSAAIILQSYLEQKKNKTE